MNDHPVRVDEVLKACPFCGGDKISHVPGCNIACMNINCGGQVDMGSPWGGPKEDGIAFLIAAWNTRAPHPIEAQGSEPVGRTGSVVSNAIHDLWFAATIISSSTWGDGDKQKVRAALDRVEAALTRPDPSLGGEPIPMVLFCPNCGVQHVDHPEPQRTEHGVIGGDVVEFDVGEPWTNPPHRSHLCHACGCIWRPADVTTVGVEAISTKGKADNFEPPPPSLGMAGVREALAKERARWDRQSTIWEHAVRKGNAPVRNGLRMRYTDDVVRMIDDLLASISTPGEGEGT